MSKFTKEVSLAFEFSENMNTPKHKRRLLRLLKLLLRHMNNYSAGYVCLSFDECGMGKRKLKKYMKALMLTEISLDDSANGRRMSTCIIYSFSIDFLERLLIVKIHPKFMEHLFEFLLGVKSDD